MEVRGSFNLCFRIFCIYNDFIGVINLVQNHCPYCGYDGEYRRLYVRILNIEKSSYLNSKYKWNPIGYVCLKCKKVDFDE